MRPLPSRPRLRALAPMLFLLALAAARGLFAAPAAPPAWAERAAALEAESRATGRGLLDVLEVREDPRVGPSVVLLRLGAPAAALPVAARVAGLAAALLAVGLLAGRRGGKGRGWEGLAGALILAGSPIWVEGALEASPGAALGIVFLLLARRALPAWAAGLLLAWSLGWSPWSWVALLPVALGALAGPREGRRAAWTTLGIGLLGAPALNPPALLHTLEWLRALLWQARLEGVLRSGIGFGLSRDAWPLWGSLHIPGLLLLAARVPGWSRRVIAGDAAPAAFAGVVVLGTLAGFPRELPLLLLLPWAASEAGAMAAGVAGTRASRGATALRVLVLAAAVGALAATTIGRAAGNAGKPPSTAEVESWLAERLPEGSLVAHDLGFAPSGGGGLRFLPIPFHAVDPASERGAYWTGWYGACRGVVLSERMIVRFLRRAEEFPDVVAFYLDLRDQAVEERAFGSRPGGRVRALLLPEGRGPLDDGWRERVARGPAGGLRGGFLATLGGELARGGALAEAMELLDAALEAGYADVGIHINLANAELTLGRPLDAGRRLDDALLLYPDSPEVLYNLAIVMTRVGYWERAVETLSRLRPLWPRSAPAAYLLGISLANSGQRGAAERVLEEVLAIDPRFPRREEVERHLATLRAGRRP